MAIFNSEVPTKKESTDSVDKPDDVIQNLKAEMNRKLSNTEAKLDELTRINLVLAEQLKSQSVPQPSRLPEKKLADLAIEDPDAYASVIEERAVKAAEKRHSELSAKQAKQNQVFSDIVAEFPEAANPAHELTKRAGELYAALPDEEKHHPGAYKQVVYQAAAEGGLKPKSKRKESDSDDFTLGGKGSVQRNNKRNDVQISQETLDFARALGRPVDNPKYIEELKKIASRNFGRYE